MAIGMSYDDFWHGEPRKVGFTIATEHIVQKQRAIEQDVLAWTTGRYVMQAVGVVMSQAFSKNSNARYPSEPELMYQLDEDLARKKRDREILKQQADFLAYAKALSGRTNSDDASPND